MDRDKKDLLRGVLKPEGAPGAVCDSRALVAAQEAIPPVVVALAALRALVPSEPDEELAGYLSFAVLGVAVGFAERNLSPRDEAHLAIVPPLLEDIRSVYGQLHDLGGDYDGEEFRFRAYDYGIHKAYYLDWRLYLSKELY